MDEDKAVSLMQAHPSLIKRPGLAYDDGLLVGYDEREWQRCLG
ncbi:MAG: ArsC/Spx/MgsR family protein [Croceibacterium sp.]